ncbi:MAG: choice-of-anchor V domain-containing protein [Candidatus Thermoplasmatota archaeon]|nr:choice-of-anchor V domain-containing protein [Candidatus Thermoplasmatota archaeon]
MLRSRRAVAIFVLMMLISSSQVAIANSTGKTGQSTAGCTCHGSASSLSPSLSGLPWGAGGYTPGATYSLNWDGGPHISGDGGFNLDASAGSWSNLGPQVQLQNGELTHSSDSLRSWSADWTAPATGTGNVDFNLAVLYANGNDANTGDDWGTGTWTLGESSSSTNTPPEAQSVIFVPTQPTRATGLAVDYTYYDADGDSEQGTQIRWKVDGNNVGSLDDQTSVSQTWLAKGQEWTCTVTVKDGTDQGDPVSIGPVRINNTLPIARNLELTPENPIDTDELRLDYEYFDFDGEPQQGTEIRWYLEGARIPELDDEDSVSPLMIRGGDQWEASVKPHDGYEFGQIVYTGVVVIGSSNNPPSATVYVSPVGNARTDDALQVNVGWTDPDGDTVQSTEIRWFRDGSQVSAYNDLTIVLAESTSKGETWTAKARVSDGLLWSDWVESEDLVILNTPPKVTSIEMLPAGTLTTSMNLSVIWEQSDVDGDPEMNSQIRWWVDGEWVREYDGMTEILASETVRDQSWSVQVVPGDGDDLGISLKTTSRQIENGAPGNMQVLLGNGNAGFTGNPSEMPSPPTTPANSLESLVVHASATDLDGEPVSFQVTWARNGFTVPDLEDALIVLADRLEPGQTWLVTITASDPWGLSSVAQAEIEIANVPPTALFSISPEPPIAGAFITLDASMSVDLDGQITHYMWDVNGASLTGEMVKVQLGSGSHSVMLTVVDDMGQTGSSVSYITFGEVTTVTGLTATLSGSEVELSWEWSREETNFRIYRSTSAFTSIGHNSNGEPLVTGLEAVGETSELSWSETAPVASNLHYAVTAEVGGLEVLWLFQMENTATVDASDAPNSVDIEPTGSISSMSLPLMIIMVLVGFASIGITMFGRRRDA